jgi:hypothetical protein
MILKQELALWLAAVEGGEMKAMIDKPHMVQLLPLGGPVM